VYVNGDFLGYIPSQGIEIAQAGCQLGPDRGNSRLRPHRLGGLRG
jgi:hypothetical protein